MSEQQPETVTVSGYGRKLCVLAEYVAPLVDKLEARREIGGGSVYDS